MTAEPQGASRKQIGWPIVSLAAMLWASDQLLRTRSQHAGLSAVQIVLFEHLALGAIFVPSLIKYRSEWRMLRLWGWLGLGFIAVFGSALATIMLTEAYRLGSPLLTALLQKTQPIFTIVLAGIFLHERRKPLFWPLFLGALTATYFLAFGFTSIADSLTSPKAAGVWLALGASAIWGTCTVVGRAAIRDQRPQVVAGWRFMLALPVLLTMGISGGTTSITANLGIAALWPLALIVLFPDALGMTLYYVGLKRTPASLATLAELAFPATALIVALVDRAESLNVGQWFGLVLLLLCLHAIQTTKSVSSDSSDANLASQTA